MGQMLIIQILHPSLLHFQKLTRWLCFFLVDWWRIGDRLMVEVETNLAINVLLGLSDSFEVQGTWELQLGLFPIIFNDFLSTFLVKILHFSTNILITHSGERIQLNAQTIDNLQLEAYMVTQGLKTAVEKVTHYLTYLQQLKGS